MKSREPVFENSRSVEDMQHMRLMALLGELVRDKGVMKAAESLDVDHRTLTSSLESGSLSRRMRVALEKALLEGGGSPAAEQRERNDALEGLVKEVDGKVDALGKELHKGLAAVQGDVKALRGEHEGVERRVAQLESAGRGASGRCGCVKRSREARGRASVRREFPDLVTLEPAPDDEEVFGAAWPLIVEWRELKGAHPDEGGSLSWLRTEERFLTVELALLGGPRDDPSPGDVSAAGLRPQRADQLAQDSALRHAEGAGEAGAAAVGPACPDAVSLVEVTGTGSAPGSPVNFCEVK